MLAVTPGRALAQSPVSFNTSPQAISINALYNGLDLTVTGEIPAASQVVVRLAGEPTTFTMPADPPVLAGEAARSLFSKFRALLEANTAALTSMISWCP